MDGPSFAQAPLISSGVPGLDDVLGGGWPPNRLYLVEGTPGVGQDHAGAAVPAEGAAQGRTVLYVTLSETEKELRGVADSHGWELDGIDDPRAGADPRTALRSGRAVHDVPSVRGGAGARPRRTILADVETTEAARASCSTRCRSCGCWPATPLRYRRQILALKQFFAGRALHRAAARRPDRRPSTTCRCRASRTA